jgi:S-DNA-T family DNA segregation ATPase FtsK/SpoIIIE
MIDPKVVELSVYNGIPHLLVPVVTDAKKAAAALNWAVAHMMERYKEFNRISVSNIKEYNKKRETVNAGLPEEEKIPRMPQIVIIIDELADLMMVAQAEVENSIQRLAQLARAAGIHLVIATQRPSVNVITGTIKANIPSRIAFAVSSSIDSRTILDMTGAEKLLGNGDMLFMPQGTNKPIRVQGAFVSDDEIGRVTAFIKNQYEELPVSYDDKITSDIEESVKSIGKAAAPAGDSKDDIDVYFEEAGRLFIEKDKATIGMLQRSLRIGFNRASRLMDQLYEFGVVGPETGTKARKILMTMEQFEEMLRNQ